MCQNHKIAVLLGAYTQLTLYFFRGCTYWFIYFAAEAVIYYFALFLSNEIYVSQRRATHRFGVQEPLRKRIRWPRRLKVHRKGVKPWQLRLNKIAVKLNIRRKVTKSPKKYRHVMHCQGAIMLRVHRGRGPQPCCRCLAQSLHVYIDIFQSTVLYLDKRYLP